MWIYGHKRKVKKENSTTAKEKKQREAPMEFSIIYYSRDADLENCLCSLFCVANYKRCNARCVSVYDCFLGKQRAMHIQCSDVAVISTVSFHVPSNKCWHCHCFDELLGTRWHQWRCRPQSKSQSSKRCSHAHTHQIILS